MWSVCICHLNIRLLDKQWCILNQKESYVGFVELDHFDHGRGERTRTFGLTVPNRARYQLRHTPIGVYSGYYNVV